MTTSFQALCSDFFVNAKLGVRMDLPSERQTLLDLFERVRREAPSMRRLRRFEGELALESRGPDGVVDQWLSIRRTSVRTGRLNPESLDEAYRLHRFVLQVAPFFLTINPIDVAHVELVFGFDLEARGNHHAIIFDALLAGSSLAAAFDVEQAAPLDVQPLVGVAISKRLDLQAYLDVKPRTSLRQLRTGDFRDDPISVFLTVRRQGAIEDMKDLPAIFDRLSKEAEALAESRVVPHVIAPLREAIASQRF